MFRDLKRMKKEITEYPLCAKYVQEITDEIRLPIYRSLIVRLTLANVPSIEYPVTMRPFRESGAHSSNSSRLGPDSINPGLARTTQGGPSAIFFSQPRAWGTLDICLVMN